MQFLIPIPQPEIFAPLPTATFDVIYADPPWQYGDKSLNRGGAERHYATVALGDLKQLPVAHVAADNAALFLWATSPLLPDALALIEAWGFQYKTIAFTWLKTTKDGSKFAIGTGHYTRQNAEICLLATRGKVLPRQSRAIRQIVESPDSEAIVTPRGRHSAKPDEVRDRIVQLFGNNLSYLELFSRSVTPGWTCWGNEVPSANDGEEVAS
jgi:N6-adenosine-specific RNA methylase IME4